MFLVDYIGCSFKFILRVGVEELRGAFTINSSTPTLRVHLNEHPIYECVIFIRNFLQNM
jgi:hypothetical protein